MDSRHEFREHDQPNVSLAKASRQVWLKIYSSVKGLHAVTAADINNIC